MTNETETAEPTDESETDEPLTEDAGRDLTYGQALEELEELLEELEGADTDVDILAERVARGVELVRFCRARLEVVSKDVDAVVSELISVESQGEQPDADPADDLEDES